MNIQTSSPLARKTFTYNPQDRAVGPDQTIELDVRSNDGRLETDTVIFANKKAIFGPSGDLEDIVDDPNHKLPQNASGNYDYPLGHANHTDSAAFASSALTVNKYNEVLQAKTGKTIDWAFGDKQLHISPETGTWPNAFYARELKGVHYFDHKDTSTGDSGEVGSHEVGHAILDAVRPGYLEGVGTETGAFHEAFGDILSQVMTLSNDDAIAKIVSETNGTGDLSSGRNSLSDVGEDFGNVLGLKGGIRTTLNDFKYQDPATLPEHGSDTQLGSEVHDFARLYAGAFYDVLDGISDANRAAGMSPAEALKGAGKEAWNLVVGQAEFAPNGSEALYKELAAGLIEADKAFNDGKRGDLIAEVMAKREILSAEAAGGLFKSQAPTFTGEVVSKEVTFGKEFGALAGVTYETQVATIANNIFASEVPTSSQIETGVKTLLAHDQILFTENATPSWSEIFKPDGSYYNAYVTTNEAGEKVLKRTHIAG
jgi:hypothetical protein